MHVGKTLERARADAVSAWAAVPGDDGIAPRAAVAAMLGLAWRRAGLLGDLLRQQAEAADDGAPGGLAELEAAERDRVVRYGKTAHDMGVQERRARLAAEAGEFLVEVSARALTALGADPHDPQVRAAVHEAIVATAAGRRWELIDGATAAGDD
jgi:hypothetical protein